MPRFADNPLRPPPDTDRIALTVAVEGATHGVLSGDDLSRHETIEQTSDFHCVTTWTYRNLPWRGVRFVDVVHDLVGSDAPPYLQAAAADGFAAVFVTADLLHPDVLLATHLDGAPLDRRHGAPLRLVSPGQYGYKNVKHLTGLDFRHDEPASTLGEKEHRRARVAQEERHRTRSNWTLRFPYRLTIIPTALTAEWTLRDASE